MAHLTTKENAQAKSIETNAAADFVSFRQAYHDTDVVAETDVLVQLRNNIQQLEDLHGRLRFAMTELKVLLKRA